MEFSFEYYQWLRQINENPKSLFLLTTVGVLVVTLLLYLLHSWVKFLRIRLLNLFIKNLIYALLITGFLGLIIFGVLSTLEASLDSYADFSPMFGIRLMLVWIVLFLFVFAFSVSHKQKLISIYNTKKEKLLNTTLRSERSKKSSRKAREKKK